MMRRTLKLAAAGFTVALFALAADPSGRWTAEFQGPQGNIVHSVLTLKAAGERLTGTVAGMRGGQTAISDGKIEDDQLTFTVIQHWQGVDFKIHYLGVMKRNVIHFTVTREGGEGQSEQFDAKRS